MIFWVLFFSFFALNIHASPIPPHQRVKTLHTEHFEIVYYAEQQELANLYATQLEKSWIFLNEVFQSRPHGRILAVINDSTDISNGFATRVPYPYMMLFPVVPDLNDTLSEYEIWSQELAVHELAHVLSFEPAQGVMKPLRSVFGTIVAPNLLLPNWWKEGLSVWTETAIGKGGRLRSIYQESILRGLYGERSFQDFTVAQANEALPDWPWGSRPYLFGSLVMSSILEERGAAVMKDLVERHGGRVPYLLSGATQPTLGQSYEEFYARSLVKWEERTAQQIRTLSKVPFQTSIQIDTGDLNVRSPTISADGRYLVWVGHDERFDSRLKMSSLEEGGRLGPVQELTKGQIREARFFPKSPKIIYNAVLPASQTELYSDLFVYDLSTRKKQRLTQKLRGREARVSPEEKRVVFVGLEGGKTHLRTLSLQDKTPKTLLSTGFDERISSPQFLDENRILFSWSRKGLESLHIYDLSSGQVQTYVESSPRHGQKVRRPLQVGRELYYLSDKNRVFNIYRHGRDANPITHVKTNVIDYAFHPSQDDLFAVVMTAQGPRLHHFPNLKARSLPQDLPLAPALQPAISVPPPPNLERVETREADRSYLLGPHYWVPYIAGSSAEEGVWISVSTSGQDPTLQHAYQAQVTYDTGVEEVSYGATYVNRTLAWPWVLNSSRFARNFAGSEETYYNQFHTASLAPDLSKFADLATQWAPTLSYVYAKYEDDRREYERHGPAVSFSYSNVNQTLFMFYPEEGYAASVAWNTFMKSSNLDAYNQYRARGNFYWSKWLPKRHAFSLEARALYTDQRIPSILGDASTVFATPLTSTYLIRGYYESQFVGRTINNINAEYRFPLHGYTRGNGTFPFYIRAIHAAAALDAISLDGFAYRESELTNVRVNTGTVFSSAGAEVRVDTTVGYLLPIQLVAGLHYPLQKSYRETPNVLLQIRGGLDF